ncbi:odorant receptor 4-like [Chelonus insularis]|uniref:odorant receptor 4-like n=1 Tax=Chelonus insularis TaxID=460826 RepID=UPI00158D411A|nr:odorant receptor 4-like [Chelonus insularis]
MSSNKISEYLTYREVVKKLLLLTGVWPVEKPSVIYRSLPYIQIVVGFSMAYVIFGFVRAHSDNINLMTRGLSIITAFLTIVLKMTCLIIYRREIYDLHELLDVYFKNLLQDLNVIKTVLSNVTTFRRLTIVFIILVVYSCGCWVFLPLYHNYQQYSRHIQPTKYALIYPTNYPWNIPTSGYIFHLHFIFETIASTILCLITTSVDSLFAFYAFQIIGQLREISHYISLVDENNNDKSIIRKCVIQYQNLMKCRDMIEKMYGPMILWIMITNAVILCTVMFQITHMKSISKGRIGLLFTWISLKTLQTFIYSWSGSQLTVESENYSTAVYCSKWYGNKSFMSSVIIMLTQRPLVLTACNFSVVSLDMFVTILNTTMSYFFLLQALETEV